MPDAARLAEIIAGDFYDDRLKLYTRWMPAGTAWSRMPEVESVNHLYRLQAGPVANMRKMVLVK